MSGSLSQEIHDKLRRRMFRLMRQSFHQGELEIQVPAAEFSHMLEHSLTLQRRQKITAIIARAHDLIADAFSRDETLISAVVHKLFRNIAEHTDVEVTAHPADIEAIKRGLADNAQASTAVRKIRYQEDDGFTRGSLVITANKNIIDAKIKTQLTRAQSLITHLLESKHG